MKNIESDKQLSLYELEPINGFIVREYIASTPETQAICNDPFVSGVKYTNTLKAACARTLSTLQTNKLTQLSETTTNIFHILRGGLNFGLREAVQQAFGWNEHRSSFTSAQRARTESDPNSWHIKEADYQKLCFAPLNDFILGDVSATGTTLKFGLKRLLDAAIEAQTDVKSILLFTIGAPCCTKILQNMYENYSDKFKSLKELSVVYFEGKFEVAEDDTPLAIKITGTDLIRRDSLLAPEFINSQYESPCYPLERCTIYDAGSRAFDTRVYYSDVREYWEEVLKLAESGMSFEALLKERFPELDSSKYGEQVNLSELAKQQIERCSQFISA